MVHVTVRQAGRPDVAVRRSCCGGARASSGRSGGQCSADINKASARVNNSGSHYCFAKQEPSLLHASESSTPRLDPTLVDSRFLLLLAVSLLV
jgi:hypothetical protein